MLKQISFFILSLIKAFWSSIVSIAWGFAGFFILMGIVTQYQQKIPEELLSSIKLLMDNWQIFFAVILFIEIILIFKELNK